MIAEFTKNICFNLKKNKYSFHPVFIIGCGRSGTTILGKTLSSHPKIKYLNERRTLWHRAYPEFNIWDNEITSVKLFANKKDIDPKKNSVLQKLFFKEQVLANASILLEKLPINNFRLDFLQNSFPHAKYIYLTRNGLEVSRSIEMKIEKGNWLKGKKWELINNAAKHNNTAIDGDIVTNEEKAMLEWRMSMESSDNFFKNIDQKRFIHLSYLDLIESPKKSITELFNFLNLDCQDLYLDKICQNIERKHNPIKETKNQNIIKIGGKFLLKTIDNTYSPI